MPTIKKRHKCYKCGRKLVADKITTLKHPTWEKGRGKYECSNKKVCKAYQ